MLTAIPLLTLPQFIMLQYVKGKAESWPGLSLYDKYNTLARINITPVVFTGVSGHDDAVRMDI